MRENARGQDQARCMKVICCRQRVRKPTCQVRTQNDSLQYIDLPSCMNVAERAKVTESKKRKAPRSARWVMWLLRGFARSAMTDVY